MTIDHTAFLRHDYAPSWCPGCSFYQVLDVLTRSFAALKFTPDDPVVVSGIGCSSRMPLFLSTFGMHTLHGRALPFAFGCKMAQPKRPVVVVAGDGDLFSIGTNHFVHAARNNHPVTVLCLDNALYAMTKNQTSPTSPSGHCGSLSPFGVAAAPLNVIEFAIAVNASFVARTSVASLDHMQQTIVAALSYRGFSFVQILSPCRTYDPNGKAQLLERQLHPINSAGGFDPENRTAALEMASRAFDYQRDEAAVLPIGVYYKKVEQEPCSSGILKKTLFAHQDVFQLVEALRV